MNNLIVDIGNSRIKLFVFQDSKLSWSAILDDLNQLKSQLETINKKWVINHCIYSSVGGTEIDIVAMLKSYWKTLVFDSSVKVPVVVCYETPETLGVDRLAAVCGAISLFPNKNVLIIDAGTAITYDVLTSDKEYLGGTISPGLNTRFKALHTFTGKLPLINFDNNDNDLNAIYGTNTKDAIVFGVQNGLIHEVQGIIDSFDTKFDDLLVVFTGGDTFFFEKLIKNRIFAEPNLIAFGLNKILEINV